MHAKRDDLLVSLFAKKPFFEAESKRAFNYSINSPVNEKCLSVPTKPRKFEIYNNCSLFFMLGLKAIVQKFFNCYRCDNSCFGYPGVALFNR